MTVGPTFRRWLAIALLVAVAQPHVAGAVDSLYHSGWTANASWRTSPKATVRGGTTKCLSAGNACATNYLHAYYATSEYYWGAYHNLYSVTSLGIVGMSHPPDSHTVSRCRQINPAGLTQPIKCYRRT